MAGLLAILCAAISAFMECSIQHNNQAESLVCVQLANREGTTLAQLEGPLREWEAAYRGAKNTAGPAKWQLHAEFLQGTYRSIVTGLARRQEHAAEAARNAAATQVISLPAWHSIALNVLHVGATVMLCWLGEDCACHESSLARKSVIVVLAALEPLCQMLWAKAVLALRRQRR